ncbi:hypothetical protein [Clostridium sp. YIM B02500]|nr:hypothetical protein [Clostridium sp. YIM B02500]
MNTKEYSQKVKYIIWNMWYNEFNMLILRAVNLEKKVLLDVSYST